MNIAKMMKDLQKMQSKMQENLNTLEVEGTSGGGVVTARMNGKKELLAVKISPDAARQSRAMSSSSMRSRSTVRTAGLTSRSTWQ